MKISRSAWHVRLSQKVFPGYQPKDLCSHFWIVVAGVVIALFTVLFVVSALGLGVLALVILWIDSRVFQYLLAHWQEVLLISGVAVGTGIVMLVSYIAVSASSRWLIERFHVNKMPHDTPPKEPKQPGLLCSWIKAKKRKICPMIEVED